MNKLIPVLFAAAAVAACAPASPYPVEKFVTPAGKKVAISMIHHASLALTYKGYNIQIDPVMKQGESEFDYSSFPKSDCILITHEHGDHFSPETISFLSKDDTRTILNPSSQQKLGYGEVISNGGSMRVGPFSMQAVPAYNVTEGRTQFHPKGRDNGYILDFDGLRIYVSGDTEPTPEMYNFGPVDIAFLSANQPYTMTPAQCVEAAMILEPKVLIPYHLSNTDMQEIKNSLNYLNPNIEVLLFEELR